jgi:hypothetical protein
MSNRRRALQRSALALLRVAAGRSGPTLPLVTEVDPSLLVAQVRRLVAALESLGAPVEGALARADVEAIQRVLDRRCLVGVHINPEMRVKVACGPARPRLVHRAWLPFLVKVRNEAGTTAALRAATTQGGWLDLEMFDEPPLEPTLSGLELEYRVARLYSHDAGLREASLVFDVGQGTQDLGFRNEVPVLFDCS